jgi:hypothetical protein
VHKEAERKVEWEAHAGAAGESECIMAMLELLGLPPQGDRLARLRALREALAGVQVFFIFLFFYFFFIPEATFQMMLDYP